MKTTTILASTLSVLALCCGTAQAAETPASAPEISRAEAKDLKAQSEAQLKANKKTAEASEELNKADCKSALDGAAKRACEKSAKAHAKSDKADAKTVHEMQEQAIDKAKK